MRRASHHLFASVANTPWRWAWAGGLLGLAVAVLLCAPARWLAAGVAQLSQGQVQFADPRGTVWNGSAQLVLAGGAGSQDRTALPERLHWQIRPAWNGLRTALQADCCMAQPLQLHATPRRTGAGPNWRSPTANRTGPHPCWRAWVRLGTPCNPRAR